MCVIQILRQSNYQTDNESKQNIVKQDTKDIWSHLLQSFFPQTQK